MDFLEVYCLFITKISFSAQLVTFTNLFLTFMSNQTSQNLNVLVNILNEIQDADSRIFSNHLNTALGIIETDECFLEIIKIVLVNQKTSIPYKITGFFKKIFEELKNKKPEILTSLLYYLGDTLSCKAKTIRKHCLLFIDMILLLDHQPQDCLIIILRSVSEKLFDKDAGTRKEALKICLRYQMVRINETLKIQNILKDVIRHDTSIEVRKMCLQSLDINDNTINCIIERAMDFNPTVRSIFWNCIIPKINLFALERPKILFLMKQAITDRNIDLKMAFIEKCVSNGFINSLEIIYSKDNGILDKMLKYYIITDGIYDLGILLNTNDNNFFPSFHPSTLHFINLFLTMKEDAKGRDNLGLLPIEDYLRILYEKSLEVHSENENFELSKLSIIYLFKILSFYDIFTNKSIKMILNLISNLILKTQIHEIVEECIKLSKRVCGNDLVNFIGSIIKKTRGTKMCIHVCECVFRHFPTNEIKNMEEMKNAIINEIAMLSMNEAAGIFYWCLVHEINDLSTKVYLSFLPDKNILNGVADLIILNRIYNYDVVVKLIQDIIDKSFESSTFVLDDDFYIVICKLLISKKIEISNHVKFLLISFYSISSERIQQYLSLFFYEYFYKNPKLLIDGFCFVLDYLEISQKIFVDQALYWLSLKNIIDKSMAHTDFRDLFFNISVFLLKHHATIKYRKFFFYTLDYIFNTKNIFADSRFNKKMIYIFSSIIKLNLAEDINGYLSKFIVNDDGTPLTTDEYEALKERINE